MTRKQVPLPELPPGYVYGDKKIHKMAYYAQEQDEASDIDVFFDVPLDERDTATMGTLLVAWVDNSDEKPTIVHRRAIDGHQFGRTECDDVYQAIAILVARLWMGMTELSDFK